jgi:hypothetical protein
MAHTVGWLLSLAWCLCLRAAGAESTADNTIPEAGELQHAGENCYFDCWKTPGFCQWCGEGNACCKMGDEDADPLECKGPLVYKSDGEHHECVVPSFKPGENPPDELQQPGTIHNEDQAQCISYMAMNDCDWTLEKSCPDQPKGWGGLADADDSIAYQCCCRNGLWRQSATLGDAPRPLAGENVKNREECTTLVEQQGCNWTANYACPGQPAPAGKLGNASDDGSVSYKCCCLNEMWKLHDEWMATPAPLPGSEGAIETVGEGPCSEYEAKIAELENLKSTAAGSEDYQNAHQYKLR